MKATFPPNFVWNNYIAGKWEQKETFCQNSLMHLFNGDRPIVHCIGSTPFSFSFLPVTVNHENAAYRTKLAKVRWHGNSTIEHGAWKTPPCLDPTLLVQGAIAPHMFTFYYVSWRSLVTVLGNLGTAYICLCWKWDANTNTDINTKSSHRSHNECLADSPAVFRFIFVMKHNWHCQLSRAIN